MADLYPEAIRSRLAQQEKVSNKPVKKTKTPGPKRSVKKATVSTSPKRMTEADIATVLQADKTKSFSLAEIAAKLGTGAAGLQLTLGKMAKANKAEKCPDGNYRAFSGNVQEMAKAS